MDAKRFMRLKDKGLTSFEKDAEGKKFLTFKRFAVDDGHEIEPEKQALNLAEIDDKISTLNLELDGLKTIRAEMEKL
jgi:hypothetical protein